MNWIKQNQFLAGFFAVMIVGVGALGFLLFSAMGTAEEAASSYAQTSSELARLQNLPLSPNQKNLDALVAQKKDAVEAIEAFQATLTTKSFPLEPMTPEGFQDKLKATKNTVVEKAVGASKLPDKFFLGFDVYETRPPDPAAAGPLGRQLKAIEWIVNQLTEARVTEVKSIKRDPLPEESGKPAPTAGSGKNSEKPLLTTHGLELTLQSRQGSLAAFLNALVGPKAPQFYSLRSIRLKNQNEKGPPRAVAPVIGSDPAPVAAPVGAAGTTPGEPPKAVSSYIVGEEQLEAVLQIDIVNFAAPATATPAK